MYIHRNKTGNGDNKRKDIGIFSFSDKVNPYISKGIFGPFGPYRKVFPFFKTVENHHSGNPHIGKERHENTDNQGYRKTFNRTRTENIKNNCGDNGSKVPVDDCRKSMLEAIVIGLHDVFAIVKKLFFGTFINDHVGIHCHGHREYDTRNTWKGQCKVSGIHNSENIEKVDDHRNHRIDTGTAVIEDDINDNQGKCNKEGGDAGVNGLLPQ